MQPYSILIKAAGPQGTGDKNHAADLLVAGLISTLRNAGHTVEHASFKGEKGLVLLVGGKEDHPEIQREGDQPSIDTVALSLEAAHSKLDAILRLAKGDAKPAKPAPVEKRGATKAKPAPEGDDSGKAPNEQQEAAETASGDSSGPSNEGAPGGPEETAAAA